MGKQRGGYLCEHSFFECESNYKIFPLFVRQWRNLKYFISARFEFSYFNCLSVLCYFPCFYYVLVKAYNRYCTAAKNVRFSQRTVSLAK